MIIDVTGIELMPGNNGKDCLGNGEWFDECGILIECCCEECDYFMCCEDENWQEKCKVCTDNRCKRNRKEDD